MELSDPPFAGRNLYGTIRGMSRPSANGENGRAGSRDAGGRFAKGNPGGPGNPYARRVARLRSLMLEAVSDDDLKAIVAALVQQAKAGDLAAAREVLNRCTGKPGYIEQADPDRVDLHEGELQRLRDMHRQDDEMGRLLGRY